MNKIYKGSCLCGRIQFKVDGFSEQAANCHCTMCRKFHGAAYGTLVSATNLKWLSGEECLKEYVAENETIRTFCECCGSSIGFRVKGESANNMELAIATFDEEIPVVVDAQIYTKYKANWVQLQSNVSEFSEGRESD